MNLEKRRKLECFNAKCKFAEQRCIVFFGKDCVKLGGTKIPCQRIPDQFRPPTQKPMGFKPYFLSSPLGEGEL